MSYYAFDPRPYLVGFVIGIFICAALVTVERAARSEAERVNAAAREKGIAAATKKWERCIDGSDDFALQATHGGDSYCIWVSRGPSVRMRLEKL